MRHWSVRYIGIPWAEKGRTRDGVDCWGLVWVVYAGELGITLPSYTGAYASVAERAEIDAAIRDANRFPWRSAPYAVARAFDVVAFTRVGLQTHVGLALGGGRMLHIEQGRESRIESYTSGRWFPRLAGVYRHAANC